jgi:hypothetical protein
MVEGWDDVFGSVYEGVSCYVAGLEILRIELVTAVQREKLVA